jgi:tRNA 2-thiouridine synthesizing protein E
MNLALDPAGFLKDWTSWTNDVAHELATNEGVTLTDAHWVIINLARQFYQEFDHAPSQRPLARYIKIHLGAEKAGSIYLMQLFGQSPAKMIALLSGLPKPKNCL